MKFVLCILGSSKNIPFGRGDPRSGGLRDRAHTVSGPSPRRFMGGQGAGRRGAEGGIQEQPVSAGAVQRGPDFLRNRGQASNSPSSSPGVPSPTSVTASTSTSSINQQPASVSSTSSAQERVTGISPQFVFLQLYLGTCFGDVSKGDAPIILPSSSAIETSIKILDRIHP